MAGDIENKNISRQLLWNRCKCTNYKKLGNTFNEEDYDTMIFAAIKEREQYIVQKNKMEINWDPKIASAIYNSQFISSKVI